MAQDLGAIKKKMEPAPIVKKPDDPAAKYRTKAEQLEVNKRNKKAKEIGEAARLKALKDFNAPAKNADLTKAETELIEQNQLLTTCKSNLKILEDELADTAPGEQRPVKMQIGKVKKKIENVEIKIKEIKEELKKLK